MYRYWHYNTKEVSVIKILDLLTKMAEHEIDEGGQVQN